MELDIIRKEHAPQESLKDFKEEHRIPYLTCNNFSPAMHDMIVASEIWIMPSFNCFFSAVQLL